MSKRLTLKLIKSIRKVTGCKKSNLHEPIFIGDEIQLVKKCIKSGYVSSIGPQVKIFEKKLEKLTGAKYVIACINGTSALHLGLKILNVERNCEVLLPSLNFVASANAIKYCGGTPHFVDSDKRTLGVNPEKLKKYLKNICSIKKNVCFNKNTGKRILALIVVHIFGYPCDIFKIKKICKEFNIELIEDAAEGIGSYYYNKHVGTFGKIGVLSFNGNKTITTGGGGALITNEKKIAQLASVLSTTGKIPHSWKYEYNSVAYNYRLPNINAAIGIAQLKSLPKILKAKRNLFYKYDKEFKKISEIDFFKEPNFCKSNHWLNTILLKEFSLKKRDYILREINKVGIQIRPCWRLLHNLKHFSNCPRMNLAEAKKLESQIISLPSSPIYGDYN